MKKTLLLFATVIAQMALAQTPVYHHSFSESLTSDNFSVGTGITLTDDLYEQAENAASLDFSHGFLKLNISAHKDALKQEGTISLWYRHMGTGTSAFGTNKPLIYWANGSSQYSEALMLGLDSGSGKTRIAAYGSQVGTQIPGGASNSIADFPPVNSQWNHFTISYKFGQEGYLKAYMNGKQIVLRYHNHSLPTNTSSTIFFTGFNDAFPSSLVGSIDEIKVFTEILTDEQIYDLYADGLSLTSDEPIYRHSFANDITSPDFTVGEDIWLVKDKENNHANAAYLSATGKGIKLDISENKTELLQEGTITLWYKYEGFGAGLIGNRQPLVFWSNGENSTQKDGMMFAFDTYNNKMRFTSYNENNNGNTGHSDVDMLVPESTAWNQYTIAYKFGTEGFVRMYVNGQRVLKGGLNHSIDQSAISELFFGGFNDDYPNSLIGSIDNIQVFSQALTDFQITHLFAQQDNTEQYGKKVYYNLDENLKDTYNAYNLVTINNPVYTENFLGEAGKALLINAGESGLVCAEVKREYTEHIRENVLTFSMAFKKIINPNFTDPWNSYIPLAYSYRNAEATGGSGRIGLVINKSNNALMIQYANISYEIEDVIISENQWYHAVVVLNDTEIHTYINGELVSTITVTPIEYVANISDFFFGRAKTLYATGPSSINYFSGALDELMIEPRAYSDTEVLDLYQSFDSTGALSVENNIVNNKKLVVYPNPTNGIVNISEVSNVVVFDIQGRKIAESKNVTSFDLTSQKTGIYFAQISTENKTETIKIVRK